MSVSLQRHGLQHARLPYPSPTLRAYSCSCPSTWWCQPTISSCLPLLFLPSVFPNIRVFSNESFLPIRWVNNWSFSFSVSPSSEYSGLIFFRMDWFDLLAVQGTLKSHLQHHSSKGICRSPASAARDSTWRGEQCQRWWCNLWLIVLNISHVQWCSLWLKVRDYISDDETASQFFLDCLFISSLSFSFILLQKH